MNKEILLHHHNIIRLRTFAIDTIISNLHSHSKFLTAPTIHFGASQAAQWVKNLPAMQERAEIGVRFLGLEDPLEKGTATHSSVSCLENPMDRGA